MALPTYNRNNRRQSYQQLPKAAYVIKILSAKVARTNTGFDQIVIAFDIAEGKYKDFYQAMFERNTNEDKQWPYDAVFNLNIPADNSQSYVWDNWNTFFADLEDSNNGFIFDGDIKKLKGKLIGGKFHIKQTEYNGNVYDHTKMRYTCVAEDVRQGKAGKLPNDKLIGTTSRPAAASASEMDGFVNLPDGSDEELPF